MTNYTHVDVEGKWPEDGFDADGWEAIFFDDGDPVRHLLDTNHLLDNLAHSIIAHRDRKTFRIGVMPVFDEINGTRSLFRVFFGYREGVEVADDFLVEPLPLQIEQDEPILPANVWRIRTDSTTAPLGIVPTTSYLPDRDATIIATTPQHEEEFDNLMVAPPSPDDALALLGYEACFGAEIDRHDSLQGSIEMLAS